MRPALLVAEREPDGALSTRKLVLETAKFNVMTAHSLSEAIEMLHLAAPALAALVVTSSLGPENDCATLAKAFKEAKPNSPVIYLAPSGVERCRWADHNLSSYEPDQLLSLIRDILGDPRTPPRATRKIHPSESI